MSEKFTYLPLNRVVLFIALITILLYSQITIQFNLWYSAVLAILIYVSTFGNSHIIVLKDEELKLISLSPFFRSHEINVKRIVRIYSNETYSIERGVSLNVYPILKSSYCIEFLIGGSKSKKAWFTIQNERKARRLFDILRSMKVDCY